MVNVIELIENRILTPRVFKVITVIIFGIALVPFIHSAIGKYIKIILIFGFFVCATDLLKKKGKDKLNDKVNISLVVFAGLYAVTIALNRDLFFSENIRQLAYMIVFFWVFFMIRKDESLDYIKKDMIVVSWTFVFVCFVLSSVSFLTYILNISEWYLPQSNTTYGYIGIYEGRLFGLYNANTCGALSALSILVSIFLIMDVGIGKKLIVILKQSFLFLNIVLQFLTLILSESRGAYYPFLVVVIVSVFVFVLKKKKGSIYLRVIVAILISALFFFSVVLISDYVQQNANKMIIVSDEVADNKDYDTDFENYLESILIRFYETTSAESGFFLPRLSATVLNGMGRSDAKLSDTTGRLTLWKAGIKVFIDNPIFGVTREGIVTKVNEVLGMESTSVVGGGLHNMYLTILASSGIIGSFFIGFAVVSILFYFLKSVLKAKRVNRNTWFSFVIVMFFLISEMVENRILYQATAFNIVFWIYLGYLYFFSLKGQDSVGEKVRI